MSLATQGQYFNKGKFVDGSGYNLYKVEEDIIQVPIRRGGGGYGRDERPKFKKVKRIRLTFSKDGDMKVFETIVEDINLKFKSFETVDYEKIKVVLSDLQDIEKSVFVSMKKD